MRATGRWLIVSLTVLLATPAYAPIHARAAQAHITSPKEAFGHDFGEDYFLASYQQISTYWRALAKESPRITVHEIGKTAEGRPHLMAIVTSPANHARLARYKEIARRLALAEGVTDDQARAMAREGKAVVWIDGGLHATEVLGAQQLGEMVYQMVSRTDEETRRILDDCIILFVHANPDGNDLTADWYMREPDPQKRTLANLPRLYQKYIGHDNNRDFFASTQAETENINRVLYHEWFPQILYNHHQSGPAGTVLWSPPLRDPFNYNQDPLLVLGLQTIGIALQTRLAVEGKPGTTSRSGGAYDGWWNGGIRNTAAFHNIIAILTEMIGGPTPMRIPLVMQRQLPTSDMPYPVAPQEWHFRQSVDYSIAANRGVLDMASKMKENFLYNIYRMGKNSIERGSRDTWTPAPHRYAAAAAKLGVTDPSGGGRGAAANPERDAALWAELRRPELRDPRGYIIPSDQPDFPTATKFVNALRETGITVHRATRAFDAAGKAYPAGSYVVLTAQAFRPHVIDMFEPQDHPDNFPYPGAAPIPPYDNAGWTLAYQMGVQFDRVLDAFSGPFERIADWNVKPPQGRLGKPDQPSGGQTLVTDHRVVDSFVALNRLLGAGEQVYWTQAPMTVAGRQYPAGAFQIPVGPDTVSVAQGIASDRGINFDWYATAPPGGSWKLRKPRVGLWDQYGGSMLAGWTRWILEQFEFGFDRVFAPQLDAGNLRAKYDALIFVEGGIPAARTTAGGRGGTAAPIDPRDIPAEYRDQLGRVTADKTLPQIKAFLENGGTVIALGESAVNLAGFLDLPIENHLVENGAPLPRTKFYAPGSVVRIHVDTSSPLGHGLAEQTDTFFDNSPVFKLGPDAASRGVKAIAWFDSKTPLRSGWAWGQQYLEGGVAAIEAPVGQGRVVLFGPEILQRAQPHGTFKFLFNAIYASAASRQ
jgi:zinc carboxypeptidase